MDNEIKAPPIEGADEGKTVHVGGYMNNAEEKHKLVPLCEKPVGDNDYVCGLDHAEADKATVAIEEGRMCSICQTIVEMAQNGFSQGYAQGQADAFAAMDDSKEKKEAKSPIITLN